MSLLLPLVLLVAAAVLVVVGFAVLARHRAGRSRVV